MPDWTNPLARHCDASVHRLGEQAADMLGGDGEVVGGQMRIAQVVCARERNPRRYLHCLPNSSGFKDLPKFSLFRGIWIPIPRTLSQSNLVFG